MSWLSSLLFGDWLGITGGSFVKPQPFGNHPLNTLAFFRGRGVKNKTNLSTDVSKKLPTGGGRGKVTLGRGQNRVKFADVLNGWYLPKTKEASA